MRRALQRLLRQPIIRLAEKISSAPKKKAVFNSLTALLDDISVNGKRGNKVPISLFESKVVIFSDMHKGTRDLADDFRLAEHNYLESLKYYYNEGYTLVCLGDCEELWENKPESLMLSNVQCLKAEKQFLDANRYFRTFGNHDLEWKYDYQRKKYLQPVFGDNLEVCEGVIFTVNYNHRDYSIFLTHGHQGDSRSDGNRFSKWFVASIWTPIQRYLDISINTVSDSIDLIDKHNIIMYQWSAMQKNLLFISGHTHKPVFASLDHVERLTFQLAQAREAKDERLIGQLSSELEKRKAEYAGKQFHKTMAKPTYFNSGCCCYSDGDITGIEISGGNICLVKWEESGSGSIRKVLESSPVTYILDQLDQTLM